MTSRPQKKTVVVGAGIIGAAIAFNLRKRGRDVTLVDGNAPGTGASFGNMASIAVSEFMPVARPAIWRQMPGWLLDPESPIRVSPRYSPKLIPWLLRFAAASRPSRVRELETLGAGLCARALKDTQLLLDEIGLGDHLSVAGCLSLYANDVEFEADRERIDMLDRFGFKYDVIGRDALRGLEPEISSKITRAVLLPDNRTLHDPHLMVSRLVEQIKMCGGKFVQAAVSGFERGQGIGGVRLDNGRTEMADEVVICAGACSGRLSRMLGEPIPLETERGYSTQITGSDITLTHSIIWPAMAFMISPTAGGIRVGGTVEMAGLDAAPEFERAKITVRRAREAIPNLNTGSADEWMGHRPALPDTIPILSASARTAGVFYATGHGHLGVTNAATTAHLMGQLIAGERPDIDLHPFRINRF